MSDPLALARSMMCEPLATPKGSWSRAAALLVRQAIEQTVIGFFFMREPGLDEADHRARFLCLPHYVGSPDKALVREAHYAWSATSAACHARAYELPPTAAELGRWLDIAERLRLALR